MTNIVAYVNWDGISDRSTLRAATTANVDVFVTAQRFFKIRRELGPSSRRSSNPYFQWQQATLEFLLPFYAKKL
jgi:hypothetical protein